MNTAGLRLHASVTWQIDGSTLEISSLVLGKKLRIQVKDSDKVRQLFAALSNLEYTPETDAIFASDNDGSLVAIVNALSSRSMIIPRKASDQSFINPSDNLSDRQVRFLNAFETDNFSGLDYVENFSSKSVVVFGLGGFGSWTALLCDRIGIGTIVGVDFDRVEISNLPRQVLFGRRHVGMKKIDACRDSLKESGLGTRFIGLDKEIKSIDDAKAVVDSSDFVFVPFGHTPGRKIHNHVSGYVAKACTQLGIPYIFIGANMIGPLWVPLKQVPCYFCLLHELDKMDGIDPARRSPLISKRAFAPNIANACSHAVWDAAGVLSGAYVPSSLGKVLGVNWLRSNGDFAIEANIPPKSCEICHRNN